MVGRDSHISKAYGKIQTQAFKIRDFNLYLELNVYLIKTQSILYKKKNIKTKINILMLNIHSYPTLRNIIPIL